VSTSRHLEVLFSPADFDALAGRDLSACTCVVFDVLRATSSMVAALANGAAGVLPAASIAEALSYRQNLCNLLLAGERDGVRILSSLSGGVDFDFGNSPREFTPERVRGRWLTMTTTNGTRALRACAKAHTVLIGSFLNLDATVGYLCEHATPDVLLVCGGTYEEAAYEDTVAAGAAADLLWSNFATGEIADSAVMARRLFQGEGGNVIEALSRSRNGRRLLSRPELADDVGFCAQTNRWNVVGSMQPGPGGVDTITVVT
jgi:2-phosphosulfolactate phosphatase